MKKILNLFVILFINIQFTLATAGQFSVTLQKTGFHRNLRYSTFFPYPLQLQTEKCNYAIVQEIPSAAYVDIDELEDLKRFNKIQYHLYIQPNTEEIASHSRPFRIYLYGDSIQFPNIINLPVHFRYHLPKTQSFEKIQFENPRLYLNCDGNQTIEEIIKKNEKIEKFECPYSLKLCPWREIDFQPLADPPNLNIPIGRIDMKSIVKWITIGISWLACYQILVSIK